MTNTRVQKIEGILRVDLPQEYGDFIEKAGYRGIDGMEIYDCLETMIHVYCLPCIIGATLKHRADGLEHRFVVLAHTGFEERIILLDTESGAVFEDGREGRKQISRSFNAWQENLVKQPSL